MAGSPRPELGCAMARLVPRLLASALRRLPAARRVGVSAGLQALWERTLPALGPGERALRDAEAGRPSMPAALWQLRERGFSPRRVIDVGACRGEWTELALAAFPGARVLAVEARVEEGAALQDVWVRHPGQVEVALALLGATEDPAVPFHVMSSGTGSSVLPEESNVPRSAVLSPMTTLDALTAGGEFASCDLLKLDVQGYELEVLRGATRLLSSVQVIVMEVATWPYNRGAPLLHEVLPALHREGFVTLDLAGAIRRPGDRVLLQLDLVLARERGPLRAQVETRY